MNKKNITETTERKPKKKGRPYEKYIIKDNSIIQCLAQTHLTLRQFKIVGVFISKLDHLEECPEATEISLKELATTINLDNVLEFKKLLKEIENISNKGITLFREETNTYFNFRWFHHYELSPLKDKVKVWWGASVPEYISCLSEHYATMLLENEMQLDSKYSALLYELLSSYRKGGFYDADIDDFRKQMGLYDVETNTYKLKQWKELKERCIEIAIKEVAEKTNIKDIKLSYAKKGKKIYKLHFDFKDTMGTPDFYSDKTICENETKKAYEKIVQAIEQGSDDTFS